MHPTSVHQPLARALADNEALAEARAQHAYYNQPVYPLLRERFRQQPDLQAAIALLVPINNSHVRVFAAAYWKPAAVVENIEADLAALYDAIKVAIGPHLRAGRANPQIALDATGGTSVMSVGAAMAPARRLNLPRRRLP